jgi:hypothetical protein
MKKLVSPIPSVEVSSHERLLTRAQRWGRAKVRAWVRGWHSDNVRSFPENN